jgi:hypothetical protein
MLDSTFKNIRFHKGMSLLANEITSFYAIEISTIGGVPFADAAKAARTFIDITMVTLIAPRVSKSNWFC